ncbi:MAG: hypothetical protein IJO32_00600 [Bacilli bacterium]|nr:hypothetical protein [Bacilli bacterium]
MDRIWKRINNEFQKELKEFMDYHNEKTKNMTEEEENRYVKENDLNRKIIEIQNKYKKKYKDTQKK